MAPPGGDGLWDYDDDDDVICLDRQAPGPGELPSPASHIEQPVCDSDSDGSQRKKRKRGRKKQDKPVNKQQKLAPLKPRPEVISLSSDDDEPSQPPLSSAAGQHSQPAQPSLGKRNTAPAPAAGTQAATAATAAAAQADLDAADVQANLCPATREQLARSRQIIAEMALLAQEIDKEEEEEDLTAPAPPPSHLLRSYQASIPLYPILVPQPGLQDAAMPAAAATDGAAGTQQEPLQADASVDVAVASQHQKKVQLVLKHKKGESKVAIRATDTVKTLLQVFIRGAKAKHPEWSVPEDISAYRVEFDGDKVQHDQHISEIGDGVEDGDNIDLIWK